MTHKTGLSTIAYQQIKSLILENKLQPGQFVNESQLQEILGLGRTPVREAILQLAENELITVHPRKGQLISFRISFQKAAASDKLSLPECIRLADLDNQFHLALVSSMGNQYATRLMNTFVDKLTIIRSTVSIQSDGRLSVSNNEHIEIINSILAGNIDEACTQLKRHLTISYGEAVKTLMSTY